MGAKQQSEKSRAAAAESRPAKGASTKRSKHQQKQYSKIHKLMKMLSLLRSPVEMNREALAAALEIDTRQIARYLSEWAEMGVKAEFNRKTRRYDITESFFMPPLELDAEEALALVLLAEHVAASRQIDHMDSAGSAIAKIVSVLPEVVRSEVERNKNAVNIRTSAIGEEGGSDVYKAMREAIRCLQSLMCRYDSPAVMQSEKPAEEFIFEPYTLMFHQRAWYVVGYNRARAAQRMYKLSRFCSAKPTGQPYVISADFSLDKYLGNAWRIMPDKTEHTVELLFEPGIAQTITETRWHKSEVTQSNEDGSITYTFRIAGLDEIAWWILGYGPKVKVLRPKALAEKVADMARATLKQYEAQAR